MTAPRRSCISNNPFPNGLIPPPGSSLGLLNDVGYGAIGPLKTPAAAQHSLRAKLELRDSSANSLPICCWTACCTSARRELICILGATIIWTFCGCRSRSMTPTQIGNLGNYVNNPFASVLTSSYYSNSSSDQPNCPGLPADVAVSAVHRRDHRRAAQREFHLPCAANHGGKALLQWTCNSRPTTPGRNPSTIPRSRRQCGLAGELGHNSGRIMGSRIPNRLYLERSLSTFDMPQQLKFDYTYDLPIGRGRTFLNNMPRPLDFICGWLENCRRVDRSRRLPAAVYHHHWLRHSDMDLRRQRAQSAGHAGVRLAVPNRTGSTIISRIRTSSRSPAPTPWAMRRGLSGACALLSSSTTNLSILKEFALSHATKR